MAATRSGERAAERIGARLRATVFEHSLTLSLRWHDRMRSGELVSRLTTDVGRLLDAVVATTTLSLVPDAADARRRAGSCWSPRPGLALLGLVRRAGAGRARRSGNAAWSAPPSVAARAESGRLTASPTDLVRNVPRGAGLRAVRPGRRDLRHAQPTRARRRARAPSTPRRGGRRCADVVLARRRRPRAGGRRTQCCPGLQTTGQLLVVLAYLRRALLPGPRPDPAVRRAGQGRRQRGPGRPRSWTATRPCPRTRTRSAGTGAAATASGSSGVTFGYDRGPAGAATGSTSTRGRRDRLPVRARAASARAPCCTCSCGCTTSTPGGSCSTASTSATCDLRSLRSAVRLRAAGPVAAGRHPGPEHRLRARTATRAERRSRPGAPRWSTSSPAGCRWATTRRSARAAAAVRSVSGAGSRSPAPPSPPPRCCCSTSRPPPSTRSRPTAVIEAIRPRPRSRTTLIVTHDPRLAADRRSGSSPSTNSNSVEGGDHHAPHQAGHAPRPRTVP